MILNLLLVVLWLLLFFLARRYHSLIENCRLIISCSLSKNCLSNPIVYVGWSLRLHGFGSSNLNTILIHLYLQICKPINIRLENTIIVYGTSNTKCCRPNYLVNTSDVRNMCSVHIYFF